MEEVVIMLYSEVFKKKAVIRLGEVRKSRNFKEVVEVRRRGFRLLVVFTALLVMLTGLLTFGSAQKLEKITFRLNWVPYPNHAYFFVAKDKGYYEDVGLDVTIERGTGSLDAVKLMDAGKVDMAMADSSTVMTGIGSGAKLKIVAIVYQNSPFTFWTRKDTGIKTPKDFEGHTIGAPPGDAQRVFFPAFAKVNGIDPDKVTWVNMAAGAKISALAAGKIDIEGNYWYTYPTHVKAIGEENLVWFRWPEYGVNNYAKSIFTSLDSIKNRPEMIRKFLEASFKAWRWLLIHPREGIEIERKYVPEVDIDLYVEMFERDKELMKSPAVLTHGLGWIDLERVEYTADLVNEYMEPETPVVASEVYTTEFLPHYTWPYPEEYGE